LPFLHRDDAFLADLLHGVGDDLAISLSALAEMEPTWAISLLVVQASELLQLRDHGNDRLVDARFKPSVHTAATNFMPSFRIA